MVCRSRIWLVGLGFRVDRDSLVGDLSDISIVVVRGVLDMLGTAIRKSNRVRSSNNTGTISSLSSIEVSLGVVISNSILVSVRFVLALGLNISGSMVDRSISRGMMSISRCRMTISRGRMSISGLN